MSAYDDANLVSGIERLLESSGIQVLELSISRHRAGVKAKAVIFVSAGTGTDDCAAATRLIRPQIQVALGVQDPEIEVSSPGIDRVFKSSRDWKAFVGERIKYLMKGESEWKSGVLEAFDGKIARISEPKGKSAVDILSVAKARLDASREGE